MAYAAAQEDTSFRTLISENFKSSNSSIYGQSQYAKGFDSPKLARTPSNNIGEKAPLEKRYRDLISRVMDDEGIATAAPLTIDALLDTLVALFDDCKSSEASKSSQLPAFLKRCKSLLLL